MFNKRQVLPFSIVLLSCGAFAQQNYVSGSLGSVDQNDSSNRGNFGTAFTTGAVTGVTPPLNIAAGSPVGWKTEFDSGLDIGLAIGTRRGNYRLELEYFNSESQVDTHTGVAAAGIELGAIDAGVLISGNTGDLGVSVADLVAAGQGEIESQGLVLNGFYDFENGSAFTPFVGLGIGFNMVDVDYAPSAIDIIGDDDSGFMYQLTIGADYHLSDTIDLFGSIRYRDNSDLEFSSTLLPAKIEVENTSVIYQFGVRYNF